MLYNLELSIRESWSLLNAFVDKFCTVTWAIVLNKNFKCCMISRENAQAFVLKHFLADLQVSLHLLGSVCASLGLRYSSVQVKIIRKFSHNISITGVKE